MTEREQRRLENHRLAVLEHAVEVTGTVAQTCRYFGISRQTFYKWLRRYGARIRLHGEGLPVGVPESMTPTGISVGSGWGLGVVSRACAWAALRRCRQIGCPSQGGHRSMFPSGPGRRTPPASIVFEDTAVGEHSQHPVAEPLQDLAPEPVDRPGRRPPISP